jgi:hypothetical protein
MLKPSVKPQDKDADLFHKTARQHIPQTPLPVLFEAFASPSSSVPFNDGWGKKRGEKPL